MQLPDCSTPPPPTKRHRASCGLFAGLPHGQLFREPQFISHRIKARHHFEWTPNAVQTAAVLWSRPQTKSQIAAHFGVTRAAVVGMMMRQRENFPKRAAPSRSLRNPHNSLWKSGDGNNKLKIAAALWLQKLSVKKIAGLIEVSKNKLSGAINRNRDLFPARPSPIKRG